MRVYSKVYNEPVANYSIEMSILTNDYKYLLQLDNVIYEISY